MHFFFLGNTPALSRLELQALFPGTFSSITPNILGFSGAIDPSSHANRLGGTRKIATHHTEGSKNSVLKLLADTLSTIPNKNIAVTDYANCGLSRSDLHSLKVGSSQPRRFVSMETSEHELILLAHQHVAELNILPDPFDSNLVNIAITTWIFDAEDWIHRDRNKPYRDIKRGMLPPKLARILVNLAARGQDVTLYDPFCGTGTVLTEAFLAGCSHVLGSDTNPDAVHGAEANIKWLHTTYNILNTNYNFQLADATHPPYPEFDAIATEPYMGPLLDERNPLPLVKIKDIAKGLDKLYRGSFKAWHTRLTPGGRVVMTIPSFAVYGRLIPTIGVDSLTALGYNYISSVAYGKPEATVIRNITILEKK